MKTIRNTALILFSLFLGLFNVVKVMAQEESFRVPYEFVSQKTEEPETTDSDHTPEADSDFYEKIALIYGEEALEYMHIVEDAVFVPDATWLNYGSEEGAKTQTEPVRTDERHKTSRWDDFPGTGYFDNNTSIRYFPGIYMIGPTDASYSEREKFEVSFCVQPRTLSFGVGTSVPYKTVSMADYDMLSDATKLKIARICTQFVRNIGGNTSAALRTASNDRSVNQKIGEALAAQSAIWRLVELDPVAQSYVEQQEGFFRMNTSECSEWGDSAAACQVICETQNSLISYYYNTVANTDISGGINVVSSYTGYVGEPIRIGTVNNPSGIVVDLPEGLVFCDAEGNAKSSPEWDGRYFYIKATKTLEGATCTITVGDPSLHEPLYRTADPYQNLVTSGVLSETVTFKVTAVQMKLGVVKVLAQTDFDYLANCPNNYSLKGAVYGVYSDQDCNREIATLATKKNGKTESVSLGPGTYYVKEKSPSVGFRLDQKVYTAVLNSSHQSVSITSVEEPLDDPVFIELYKANAHERRKTKDLDKAEFTVCYYDTQSDDLADLEPLFTWVFKPIIFRNRALVYLDEEHYVSGDELLQIEKGGMKIPLGTITIQETKAPPTYEIDPNIYIGHIRQDGDKLAVDIDGGEYLKVEGNCLIQYEKELIVRTMATFKESGTDTYYADGEAVITDTVVYDNLLAGQSYTLKAILVDKKSGTKETETEKVFVPEEEKGETVVEYEALDFDDLADTDHVSYEYLYLTEDYEKLQERIDTSDPNKLEFIPYSDSDPYLLAYHEDLLDEEQTVHVKALYKAEMILCKTGEDEIKLNGAYFDITTRRVKRDGTVMEQDLGRYVTGGIFYEKEEPFTLIVARDEQMKDIVKEYASSDEEWNRPAVSVLDLKEGVYYAQVKGEETVRKWIVSQGMIYLEEQPEDTQITYTEIQAPKGYYLDPEPFIIDVGHDTSLASITNYRVNKAIYIPPFIPITGIE